MCRKDPRNNKVYDRLLQVLAMSSREQVDVSGIVICENNFNQLRDEIYGMKAVRSPIENTNTIKLDGPYRTVTIFKEEQNGQTIRP